MGVDIQRISPGDGKRFQIILELFASNVEKIKK